MPPLRWMRRSIYAVAAGLTLALAAAALTRKEATPYLSVQHDEGGGNLILTISPSLFCAGHESRTKSELHRFSFIFDGDDFALIPHEEGAPNLLLLQVRCTEPFEAVTQPLDSLKLRLFDEEAGGIVTERGEVFRFIQFLERPPQEIISAGDEKKLAAYLYDHGGVAVGSCYAGKETCYWAIAKAPDHRENSSPAESTVDYIWGSVKAPAVDLTMIGRKAAMALLASIDESCSACAMSGNAE